MFVLAPLLGSSNLLLHIFVPTNRQKLLLLELINTNVKEVARWKG